MKHIIFEISLSVVLLITSVTISANAAKHGSVTKWSSSLPTTSVFVPSEELAERVEFWRKIYSVYTTHQGVFHLPNDPNFILGEIDLTGIYANSVSSDKLKKKLAENEISKKRLQLAAKWKIADSRKIRLQMGLKDRMQKAFFLSGRYLPMMEKVFRQQGLPVELTRIVFVESSFNILAQSKVGASGLWQIMPNVARPLGYITAQYDKRNDPFYATELAAAILKENFRKLGSWPLAITAYNHGLTGIQRMKNKANSNQIEDLIDAENHTSSWGFASRNFYACFLAVLEVEKRANELFGQDLVQSSAFNSKEYKLKQPLPKLKILQWYNGSIVRFRQMNPHLNWTKINRNKKIPAGIPLQIPTENYHLAVNQKS